MLKLEKFQISKAPYAIRHDAFRVVEKWSTYTLRDGTNVRGDSPYYSMTVEAVWFRRKSGILTAHLGHLWGSTRARPIGLLDWVENDWDGRYGGHCRARYDGASLWAPEVDWETSKQYQVMLSQMLDNFPVAPEGYDGWWTYKQPKESR